MADIKLSQLSMLSLKDFKNNRDGDCDDRVTIQ